MPTSLRPPVYLTILRKGDTHIVDLAEVGSLIPRSEVHVEQSFLQELTAEITRAATLGHRHADRNTDAVLHDLQHLGGLIFSHLLSDAARKRLRLVKDCDLYLRLDEQLVHLPWELCHDGHDFLATKFRIGRQVITGYPVPEPTAERDPSDSLRVLLIADPTESLPEASREAEQLCSLLDTVPGVEVTLMGGRGVRKVPLLAALQAHDVVHFAGHSHYDPHNPQKSGWRLHEGLLTPQELGHLTHPPLLVFSNSCQAGATSAWGDPYQFDQSAFGIGSAFLLAGVRNYVGTFWIVHDEESVLFATTFYQHVVSGDSLGAALRQARHTIIQQRGWHSLTWASYMLYGDPGFSVLLSSDAQLQPHAHLQEQEAPPIFDLDDDRAQQEAVRQYEYEQCEQFDLLGRQVPFATHYQALPLLREVKRERLLRQETHLQDRKKDKAPGELRTADILRWEEELQEAHVAYEQLTLLHLFHHFRAVVKTAPNDIPRFIVLGPPGSGKTTLTQFLSRQAAARFLHIAQQPLLPIRLRLREWEEWASQVRSSARELETYLAFAYRHLSPAPTAQHWQQWLQKGSALLLLDGLDELDGQPEFLSLLRTTLAVQSRCPTVITCRTVSFEQHRALCSTFPLFTLASLSTDKRDAFIRAFPFSSSGYYDAEALIEHLARTPSLLPLATNPLLLSIICFVTDDAHDGGLPATRAALYHRAVQKLLTTHAQRIIPTYPGAEPTADEKLAILERAALTLFARPGQALAFSGQELGLALREALSQEGYGDAAAPWANALRVDLTDNSGLIRGGASLGFFFLHLTIQEFLAAKAIARLINKHGWRTPLILSDASVQAENFVDRKVWDPRWHEVILLLAGQLTDPTALFQLLASAKKDDLFGNRLALATRCLPETHPTFLRQQASLVTQIITQAVTSWLQHEQADTAAVVAPITRAFPALGQVNGTVHTTPLVQWLYQQAQGTDSNIRAGVVKAFGYMGEVALQYEETLATLTAALQDPDIVVRAEAIVALHRIGPVTMRLSPLCQSVLQSAVQDSDVIIRTRAKALLELALRTTVQKADLNTAITGLIHDEDQRIRSRARDLSQHLSNLQHHSTSPVHILLSEGEVEAPKEPRTAADSRSDEPLPALLRKALYHNEAAQRSAAIRALTLNTSVRQYTQATPLLVQVLREENETVRTRAIELLQKLGTNITQHSPVIAAVQEIALHDKNPAVRIAALEVCGQVEDMGTQSPRMLLTLQHALQHDKEVRVRAWAARTIGRVGVAAAQRPELVTALITSLQEADSEVRFRAAEALGQMMSQGVRFFRRWWKKVDIKKVEELAALSK